MEVRCLASARSAEAAFDLRCEVREKMIVWLQFEHPDALLYDRNLTEWIAEKSGSPSTASILAEAMMNRPVGRLAAQDAVATTTKHVPLADRVPT